MRLKFHLMLVLALCGSIGAATLTMAQSTAPAVRAMPRPTGPCDIYAAAGDPCVAAHSTTRALYASYDGPLYQVLRQSDGRTLNIGIVPASTTDAGGYARAAAQDKFCSDTYCWISKIYDQSPKHNDLFQAPRGAFSGPAMGGFNNLPLADMAPVSIGGHKVYGVFIAPGMGIRLNDPRGTAVDDQAQGQYWVINGLHYNSGCCFDYGNAEIDSKDDGNGTMETTYYGNSTGWYHGNAPGPWVMTDQENNLVGCVNKDSTSKLCTDLPSIDWRFVTGMAKGAPHRWASLAGDAQHGPLQVMFDGPRVDVTYDPMRKQGAILLGNGGDNSVASQGTFYEGAMTAAGTFPTDATDQSVQANVVAAGYGIARLTIAAALAGDNPTGLQTFAPGSSQETVVTFTNTSGAPATSVILSLSLPKGWSATAVGNASFAEPIAPGASVNAVFKVTSGSLAYNGDIVANASWTASGAKQTEKMASKVRNVSPVKINEFRVSDGSANTTNSFIELYNADSGEVDISNWSLTQHQTQRVIASAVKIPAGTKLASRGFYLLGLANSGLAVSARAGDAAIHVRNTDGIKAGDPITVGTGKDAETRRIAKIGSAAGSETTLWQPAEDPMITIPAGSSNVPVASTAGFVVGQKIALGYGATYPAVSRSVEKYEIATVTAVGKPGTQAFLAADAAVGAIIISVSSVTNITAGDKIRLDIASVGHGIETVTVKSVGTAAIRDALAADVRAGATTIRVRPGFGVFNNADASDAKPAVGDRLIVGMPDKLETVTITAVNGDSIEVRPALTRDHLSAEPAIDPGTGLELTAPLKFGHAGNLPFSARGTGISFSPATAFAHSSNEPIVPLGTGITFDQPLAKAHAIDAAVRRQGITAAGYHDAKAPDQWFGGPALATNAGSMVLRDAAGRVVDSLNYGLLVDPWASEGYHAVSGTGQSGCRVTAPGIGRAIGRGPFPVLTNSSAGRRTDGGDSDSNCIDFAVSPATVLPEGATTGATNIKVTSVADFSAGQTVMIDPGANGESATIAAVGTAGATTASAAVNAAANMIPVVSVNGFIAGQPITIDDNANREKTVVATVNAGRGGPAITVTAPLARAHAANVRIVGSGITLSSALSRPHAAGAQVVTDPPTPGTPNKYSSVK
jgi:hypothetical protein